MTCLYRAAELDALEERRFVHQHNEDAVRFVRSPGDLSGLKAIGLHFVRVPAGGQSSEHHAHEIDEEFVFILAGRGQADIGEESHDVGPGDLMVFPAGSPAHALRNPGPDDLVFLVSGTRSAIDICTYPRKGLRQYRIHGRREVVDAASVRDLGILHPDQNR